MEGLTQRARACNVHIVVFHKIYTLFHNISKKSLNTLEFTRRKRRKKSKTGNNKAIVEAVSCVDRPAREKFYPRGGNVITSSGRQTIYCNGGKNISQPRNMESIIRRRKVNQYALNRAQCKQNYRNICYIKELCETLDMQRPGLHLFKELATSSSLSSGYDTTKPILSPNKWPSGKASLMKHPMQPFSQFPQEPNRFRHDDEKYEK